MTRPAQCADDAVQGGISDVAARVVTTIALVPLLFGAALLVSGLLHYDDAFVLFFVITLAGPTVGVLLWRRFVRWTRARIAGTTAIKAALLVHVLVWVPLWDVGCIADDFLRGAQCTALLGLAIVGNAAIWWGAPRLLRSAGHTLHPTTQGRRIMSPTAIRVLLALALVLVLTGLWFVVLFALNDLTNLPDPWTFACANATCTVLLIVVWWLVWRSVIPRGGWWGYSTAASAIVLVGVVAAVSVLAESFLPSGDVGDALVFSITPMACGFWMIFTAWTWRAKPVHDASAFDAERLTCIKCGYSLVGLHEARCPECGWRTTLDDLFRMTCAPDPLA